MDCSAQSVKEQLSLIASRLILEVLYGSESTAYVQTGHLHPAGRFNASVRRQANRFASRFPRGEVAWRCGAAPLEHHLRGALGSRGQKKGGSVCVCVLPHHGSQKCILGSKEGFVIVCVRLLMAICFNYAVYLHQLHAQSCSFSIHFRNPIGAG